MRGETVNPPTRCEACGADADGLNHGIAVFGTAAERLGISEDTAGGYTLCNHCADIADAERSR